MGMKNNLSSETLFNFCLKKHTFQIHARFILLHLWGSAKKYFIGRRNRSGGAGLKRYKTWHRGRRQCKSKHYVDRPFSVFHPFKSKCIARFVNAIEIMRRASRVRISTLLSGRFIGNREFSGCITARWTKKRVMVFVWLGNEWVFYSSLFYIPFVLKTKF